MSIFRKLFNLDQLTIRTFGIFWSAFIFMLILLVILPYFDARHYSLLKENEQAVYQKEIISTIRMKRLNKIIAGVPVLPIDKFDGERPILFDPATKQIFGALKEEEIYIYRFAENSHDIVNPKQKNFKEIKLVGPFQVYININQNNQSFFLFFISRVNPHLELLQYLFDKPWYIILLMTLISTPLIWWFTRTIIKPIKVLQQSANAVALGNFKINKKLSTEGPLELRQVGQSFSRMATAIDNLISNQQLLLSSISHELKTPLTRLQLSTALIRRQIGENAIVKRLETDIERMDKMITDLLYLSRQQMHSHTERDVFSASKILQDVIEDAQFEAEQHKIQLTVINRLLNKDNLQLNGNFSLLVSAVENIIRNALKYTKNKIELSIFRYEEFLRIRVDDNGAGLAPDEYEKIFRPFYRVDEARTRTTGGTGLGLAIVSNVVNEHQGSVWAEKSHLGGLAITISLPLWVTT